MGNNSTQIGNNYGYQIISIEPNSIGSNLSYFCKITLDLEIFLDYPFLIYFLWRLEHLSIRTLIHD